MINYSRSKIQTIRYFWRISKMKIISWNVNSVRSRINNIKKLVKLFKPDVICLQETKVENSNFPLNDFKKMGFAYFALNGIKSYNGVCICSKIKIQNEKKHTFCAKNDARHISTKISNFEIHNLYIPAGGDEPDVVKNPKFNHKISFLDELFSIYEAKNKNLLLCGDFNIAPLEDDVWSHKQLINTVSHTKIEREKLLLFQRSKQLVDLVRKKINPPSNIYTWWSYRSPDFTKNNRGRRLDHIWCSENISKKVCDVKIHKETRSWDKPSDHVPIGIIIET